MQMRGLVTFAERWEEMNSCWSWVTVRKTRQCKLSNACALT